MKVREFEILVNKLELKTRDTGDRHAWFEYEGKVMTRTKRSHGHGELPQHLIRQQLKLTEQELTRIVDCTLRRDDYVAILKKKGLISQ